jgi:hypothetical protein
MNPRAKASPLTLAALLGCLVGSVTWMGCDTDSSTSDITITPSAVALSAGKSQEFVASGGYSYKWTLQKSGVGYLSSLTGDRVVYTAPGTASSNTTQVIEVTAFIEGTSSGSGSTNVSSSSYSETAEAIVTFK